MHILCFDVETIHDREGIEKIECPKYDLSSYDEYIEYMKEKKGIKYIFPPLPFHKVVCWCGIYVNLSNSIIKKFESCESEIQNISSFWKIINAFINNNIYPTIVTYNGKTFDLPIMALKGLKILNSNSDDIISKGLSLYFDNEDTWEKNKPNYTNRFSKYNIDVYDLLSSGNRFSLEALCYLLDIPVKTSGKFYEIEDHLKNGMNDKIIEYCLEDVKGTLLIYLTYLLIKKEYNKNIILQIKEKLYNNIYD